MKSRRRILLIAYYFPPYGMGGVQRAAKFTKYLPQYGWDVTVLTVKDIVYYQKDESLLNDVVSADINRTGSFDPLRVAYLFSKKKKNTDFQIKNNYLTRIFRFFDCRVFIPDSKILWLPFAYFRACKIIRKKKIQAVLSTAPPFSSHVLGLMLTRTFRIPWIADFRDGWTDRDILPPGGAIYRKLHRILEKAAVKKADKVVGISQKITSYLMEIEPQNSDKFIMLNNGFDEEDFRFKIDKSDRFSITLVGTVTQWTDPSVFIPGIARALECSPLLKNSLEIQIIGNILHAPFKDSINRSILIDNVMFIGYLPHHEALKRIMQSQILLFPVTKYDTPGIITGKLFEYIASGIPILAHTPPGEARDILEKYGSETFFDDGEQCDKTAEYILSKFFEWQDCAHGPEDTGKYSEPYLNEKTQLFSRKNQTKMLANLLDEITGVPNSEDRSE